MRVHDGLDEYRVSRGRLTIQTMRDAPDDENEWVLIEGNAAALEFLGRLLIAHARDKSECNLHVAPIGAGGRLFTDDSDVGIYVHRIPCVVKRGVHFARSIITRRKRLRRRGMPRGLGP